MPTVISIGDTMTPSNANPIPCRSVFTALGVVVSLLLLSGTALAERVAAAVPVANIRSGPGQQHDILWQIEMYHPLEIVKRQGAWYQFQDFDDELGWVHKSLVKKMDTVITAKEKCNVRTGPGTRYKIAFTVERGIPFKVLKRKGSWLEVQHADGDKGWIFKNLLW
jgi:SH3-like domain-containing protein